jgi:hypothetical protein
MMNQTIKTVLLTLALLGAATVRADDAANVEALKVMDAFMAAFNKRDAGAWADTLVYPHVRFASGKVAVYPDRDAFIAGNHLQALVAQGWDHSAWDSLEVVQSSPDKVHITVTFTRYRKDGTKLASFPSLYIVERVDGRWGVRARSSFAP